MKKVLAYIDPAYGYEYKKGRYYEVENPHPGNATTPYLCASCGHPLTQEEIDYVCELLELAE